MRRPPAASIAMPRCRFRPRVMPYASEFRLYAESVRIGELAWNSEDFARKKKNFILLIAYFSHQPTQLRIQEINHRTKPHKSQK